jgi:t-SNARE complex subunit (syntaxin)
VHEVVVLLLLAWIIVRMEALMADFSRLTSALVSLAAEVTIAVDKIGSGVVDPTVQPAIDAAAADVQSAVDKLTAAAPPPPPAA